MEKAQYGFVDLEVWLRNERKGLGLEEKSSKVRGKEKALSPEKGKSSRKHKAKWLRLSAVLPLTLLSFHRVLDLQ